MDKNKCNSCGESTHKCSCKNKDFTKAVIQIDNPEQITNIRKVVIPASMGDDTTVPPTIGKYHNVLLYYEANQKSYLYSSDGIPTQLVNGVTDYEAAVNLPQINGVTLLGNKSAADLGLADAPMVITVANGNTNWSGADTAEDVYNFFLNKGKVNIVFNGERNYSYEITSAAYIPGEEKMMCTLAVATIVSGEPTEFEGNALFGTMTLYTANKAIDVSQIELQPKLYIADFTGLDLNYNELSGVPATSASIGMVKPGDGLEVASDGTLSISDIEQYAHFFDTVADMKSSTNLIDGSYAKTLGFTTKGDEGGATYKIRELGVSETANNIDIISLHDNIVAELITEPVMTTRQFGSGTNADADVLAKALTACDEIILSDNLTIAPQQIEISSNKVIDFNGHKITMGNNNNISWANLIRVTGGHVTLKNGEIDGNSEGQTVAVVTNNTGVLLTSGKLTVDNMKIHNCLYEGIVINGVCDAEIRESELYDCGRNEIAVLSWQNVSIENCKFSGSLTGGENIANIDTEPYEAQSTLGRLFVNNCLFADDDKLEAVSNYLDQNQTGSADILYQNCTFYNKVAVGYDRGKRSIYRFINNSFRDITDKPAFNIYATTANVTFEGSFRDCSNPIKIDARYTWDYINDIKIKAKITGTTTKALEIVPADGAMTYDNPFSYFDIEIDGPNTISGWKLLHKSVIKTRPLISTDSITLDDQHFYSEIYMKGYGKYVDIDAWYNKSKNIGIPFKIVSDVNNIVRCTHLPALNANIGNGGIIVPGDGSSFHLTLYNYNYNKFMVENIVGIYTPRTVS